MWAQFTSDRESMRSLGRWKFLGMYSLCSLSHSPYTRDALAIGWEVTHAHDKMWLQSGTMPIRAASGCAPGRQIMFFRVSGSECQTKESGGTRCDIQTRFEDVF